MLSYDGERRHIHHHHHHHAQHPAAHRVSTPGMSGSGNASGNVGRGSSSSSSGGAGGKGGPGAGAGPGASRKMGTTTTTMHATTSSSPQSSASSSCSSSSSSSSSGSGSADRDRDLAASLLQVVEEGHHQQCQSPSTAGTSEPCSPVKPPTVGHVIIHGPPHSSRPPPTNNVEVADGCHAQQGQSRKMGRRHSQIGMTTPDAPSNPGNPDSFSSTSTSTSPAAHGRVGARSAGLVASGALPSSIAEEGCTDSQTSIPTHTQSQSQTQTQLQLRRDTSDDGEMRPARRKVHRVDDDPPSSFAAAGSSSATPSPALPTLPRKGAMDIAGFSTSTLLHLLAELLARIAAANDAIRTAGGDVDADAPSSPTSSSSLPRGGAAAAASFVGAFGPGNSKDGTVTPPAGGPSRLVPEPVTPAVPFSSPVASPGGRRRSASVGYPFPRSNLAEEFGTASGSTSGTLLSIAEAGASSSSASPETADAHANAHQPRFNFASPSRSASRRHLDALHHQQQQQQHSQGHGYGYGQGRRFPPPSLLQRTANNPTVFTSAAAALATPNATLCFHARNVPSISIESYLVRISKYCPTTNEVFISLLIYFDRMSRLPALSPSSSSTPYASSSASSLDPFASASASAPAHFAVDSFNIHRLIISGITVASKFFSDIFYTNSRYAKVGGLPLQELNALELQFLLLNGFDLGVSMDTLQTYADWLLEEGALPPVQLVGLDDPKEVAEEPPIQPDVPPASRTASGYPSPYFQPQNVPSAQDAALRQQYQQQQQQQYLQSRQQLQQELQQQHYATRHSPAPFPTFSAENTTSVPSADALAASAGRPKNSFRSASESSTSASETSTVVPSEDSVSTQRRDDDEDKDAGLAGAGAGEVDGSDADAATGQDGFAERQRAKTVRGSEADEPVRTETPASATSKKSLREGSHRRENSRTREWMMSQQQQLALADAAGPAVPMAIAPDMDEDGDTEMSET